MTLEETLSSIDATLKALLVCAQTGASAVTQLGEPEAPKKTRSKKDIDKANAACGDALLDGDAPGTTYWINEATGARWIRKPGDESSSEPFTQVSAALYKAKDDEAKKALSAAAVAKATADTAPIATPQQAAASKTSANEEVVFKTVVDKLMELSKSEREGCGRAGLMTLLNKHLAALPEADRKVPKLEALRINGELIAEIDALLTDAPAAEAATEFDPFA